MLTKLPVPVPSVVFEPVIVGFAEVPQQTPLAVTSAPPSEVTLPPDFAPVTVMSLIAAVVSVGGSDFSLHPFSITIPETKKTKINKLKTFFMIKSVSD